MYQYGNLRANRLLYDDADAVGFSFFILLCNNCAANMLRTERFQLGSSEREVLWARLNKYYWP